MSEVIFETVDLPQRTRGGTPTVLTDELLDSIAEQLDGFPQGKLLVVKIERPTPGSAAGMGYNIKEKLAEAPRNLKVRSKPTPVDPEAWDALMQGKTTAEQADEVQRIKASGTAEQREAIRHYLGFFLPKNA